jgi:hypothetical protein
VNEQTNDGIEVTRVPNEPTVITMEDPFGAEGELTEEQKRAMDPAWAEAVDYYRSMTDADKARWVANRQIMHLNELVGHLGHVPVAAIKAWIESDPDEADLDRVCSHGFTVREQWLTLTTAVMTLVETLDNTVYHKGHLEDGRDVPPEEDPVNDVPNALNATIDLGASLEEPEFNPLAGLLSRIGGLAFGGEEDDEAPEEDDVDTTR